MTPDQQLRKVRDVVYEWRYGRAPKAMELIADIALSAPEGEAAGADCAMCHGVGSHGEPPTMCTFCKGSGLASWVNRPEAAGAGGAVAPPQDFPMAQKAGSNIVETCDRCQERYGHVIVRHEAWWKKLPHKTALYAYQGKAAPPAPKTSAQALTEDEAIGLVRIASTDNMYMFGNFIGAEFSRAAALALVRSVEAFHGIPAPARMNDDKQEGVA